MAMPAKTVIRELKVPLVHPVHPAALATMVPKAMLVLHQSSNHLKPEIPARLVPTVVPAVQVKQAVKETTVPLVRLVPKEIPAPWVVQVPTEVQAIKAHRALTVRLVTVVSVLNIAQPTAAFLWMEPNENFEIGNQIPNSRP